MDSGGQNPNVYCACAPASRKSRSPSTPAADREVVNALCAFSFLVFQPGETKHIQRASSAGRKR